MLGRLRTHVKGWLGMVILVMISIPFALFGLQNYSNGGSEAPVAAVGGYEIYQSDINRAYQIRVRELKEQYGDQYSANLFNEDAVRNETMNRLVQEQLIKYTVNKDGYVISDKAVLSVISKMDAFQENGQFNKQLYTELLQARGLTTEGFVQRIREDLTRDQFISSIVDTTLVDNSEIENFYRLSNQTRDIRYLFLPVSAVVGNVEVSEEEVNKYYTQNEHLFKTSAQASIDYIELSLAELMLGVKPTEEELLAFYNSEKDTFTVVGRRRASHILFEAPSGTSENASEAKRSEAEAVLARIRAGEDFAALAKEHSDDTGSSKTGGDLGIISAGMMDEVFETTLDNLKEGETSDIIQTAYGFQIIKLTEMAPASIQSFVAVKDKVEELYKTNVAGEKFYQLAERFAELSFENPDSLEPLVEELDLPIKQQLNVSARTFEGIAAEAKIRQVVFSEDVLAGNNSEVIELAPEHLVVLRVNKYQPVETMSLETVRAAVELSVKTDKAGVIQRDEAEKILSLIKLGESVDGFAKSDAVELIDVGPITRNDEAVPGALLQDVFGMSHPKDGKPAYRKSVLSNGDVAIIELTKITDGDKADMTDVSRKSFERFLAQLTGKVTLTATLANLSVEADVVFANKPE